MYFAVCRPWPSYNVFYSLAAAHFFSRCTSVFNRLSAHLVEFTLPFMVYLGGVNSPPIFGGFHIERRLVYLESECNSNFCWFCWLFLKKARAWLQFTSITMFSTKKNSTFFLTQYKEICKWVDLTKGLYL